MLGNRKKEELSDKQQWYLERYISLSDELRTAYTLKEACRDWFEKAKQLGPNEAYQVKRKFHQYYELVGRINRNERIHPIYSNAKKLAGGSIQQLCVSI